MRPFLLGLLFLLGCGTAPDAECRKMQGALWECDGAGKNCRCAEPTTDAGQQCFDATGCQAHCIYKSGNCNGDPSDPPIGACQSNDAKYGCFEVVTTVTISGTPTAQCASSCP